MEKEKERARLAGVIPAEPAVAEAAEDVQKERRLFQLHMCEVGAVPGRGRGPFRPGGMQGTALLRAAWGRWSLSLAPPPKQPHVGAVRDPRLSLSHCVPAWSWLRDPPIATWGPCGVRLWMPPMGYPAARCPGVAPASSQPRSCPSSANPEPGFGGRR